VFYGWLPLSQISLQLPIFFNNSILGSKAGWQILTCLSIQVGSYPIVLLAGILAYVC
jgi:hypothetical protein